MGILKYFESKPLKEFSVEQMDKLKFKCRIAFVDDEEQPYVERLQKDGYSITPLEDIENIDAFMNNRYQVVILDIQGVGKKLSPGSEGWGVLKYIKNEYPHTIVIMYTGAEWSITKYQDLASLADDFIGKDLEFLDFKTKIDAGIKKAFSFKYHFDIEKQIMKKEISDASTLQEIEDIVFKYGQDHDKVMRKISKKPKEILSHVESFLSIASNLIGLLV